MAARSIQLQYLKPPHSVLERISKRILPESAHLFLFSQPDEFPTARFFMGALFGAVSGAGLFLGLFHNLKMTTVQMAVAGYAFVGGALSSSFRCSALLMFPSILGSRGRAYLMLFVLFGLYNGPISNIQRNIQDVAFSMGCNIELQIKHSKVMWKVVMDPFMQVMEEIMDDNKEFLEEAKNVSKRFQNIRDEVVGQYGYDNTKPEPVAAGNSSQDMYTAKTMMRCDYVVEEGIDRCQKWFDVKWQECMDAIQAPVINQILCVSMKFHFLCDAMRVMTPWCRDQIPIEKNFGQTFDTLNFSIDELSREFSTKVVLKNTVQGAGFGVSVLQENFTESLRQSFEDTRIVLDQLLGLVQLLLSFTFLTIFTSAFRYASQYTQDIRFDNIYITTYFRQIDARRKTAGKCYLLPLKRAERVDFINPLSLAIHSSELKQMAVGLLQVLSLAVFVVVLLAVDLMLYNIFDIIRRHTLTEFSLTSSHHIDIKVDGQSMMAKLLRRSIGAFNTSSNVNMQSTNKHCLPQPRALTAEDYLWSTVPLLMMALMCCLQVYTNRLRRVIAAFYFPKREKRRALFLYNLQIQRRLSYTDRQRRRLARLGQSQKSMFPGLLSWLERHGVRLCVRCWVCQESQRAGRAVECPSPGCLAVYCPGCWRDMDMFCYACTPVTLDQPEESCSDTDVHYVG